MWLFYVVIIVILGSLGAVVGALLYMRKMRKLYESIDVASIRAEVLGDKDRQAVSYEIYDPYKLGNSRWSIDFHTDKDQYLRLNVSQKDYYKLNPGMYGQLTYHANKFVSFKRMKGHEEARQKARQEEEQAQRLANPTGIRMYADMPDIGFAIPSDHPRPVTKDEVYALIDRIYENRHDNFFGLEGWDTIIQFANGGTSEDIVLDIPDMKREGSYQEIYHTLDEVKNIVDLFFDGRDIALEFDLEFRTFE